MDNFIEQDCTFEHEGREFSSGGAVITDNYVIGYMSDDMTKITTWHGEEITSVVKITAKWHIRSYISSHSYQVRALVNGAWFTGRTLGGGMIVKMKRTK